VKNSSFRERGRDREREKEGLKKNFFGWIDKGGMDIWMDGWMDGCMDG
jgi:hypothetical protein